MEKLVEQILEQTGEEAGTTVQIKFNKEKLQELKIEQLISLAHENDVDIDYYEDWNELLEHLDKEEIMRATYFGNIYTYGADYLGFDAYGNFETITANVYKELLIEALLERGNNI